MVMSVMNEPISSMPISQTIGHLNQQLAFDAIDHLRHEQGADRIADRADRQEQDRATRTSAVPTDQFGCIAKESIVAGVP